MAGKRLLCLRCSKEVIDTPENPLMACPNCGANGVPADLDEDMVTVKVTWHELRVLVMWAEFWASANGTKENGMSQVVYGIADRLQMQHMDKHGLTFASELAELRADPNIRGPIQQNVIREPEDQGNSR